LTYQEISKNGFIFLVMVSLQNFSSETFLSSSKSGDQVGALRLSTGGSREFDDQRKKCESRF
jgi:hypothetical protein